MQNISRTGDILKCIHLEKLLNTAHIQYPTKVTNNRIFHKEKELVVAAAIIQENP